MIAGSSEQTPSLVAASATSLPDLDEGGPAVVDISKFTAVKIFDKRSSPFGMEYKCEFGPLWLAADLVEKGTDGLAYTLACADLTRDFSPGSISRLGPFY